MQCENLITWLRDWFDDIYASITHTHTISNVTNLQGTLDNKLEASDILDMVYPIGAIYISTTNVSPAILFGGTWEQISNRFLLASENGQGLGQTGGEASVSLTESQMPRHTHIQNSHNHTQNSHQHQLPNSAIVYYSSDSGSLPNGTAKKYVTNSTPKLKVDSTTATNQATTATNKYTGGSETSESASNGAAHNNMPPYLIVNVWQRVEDPE